MVIMMAKAIMIAVSATETMMWAIIVTTLLINPPYLFEALSMAESA
jgi:hypothetical protein